MSQNNHSNRKPKRTARERLRQEREKERAAERRKRTLKVAAAAVAVLAIAAGAGIIATGRDSDDSGNGPEARPVSVGQNDAPATLTVYEDFRCPACAAFETGFRDTIHELTGAGKLRVEYHLVTIIDGNLGGSGSRQAANAAACARDEGKFTEYHDVLFARQPAETEDAYADTSHLLELADEVSGLDSPAFRDCVTGGKHDDWVRRSNAAFLDSGYNATPTVLLNGEDVYGDSSDPLTPERLEERVNDLAS